MFPDLTGVWYASADCDPIAFDIYKRHYSFNKKKRRRTGDKSFAGVGEKMVLMTLDYDALFVWRKGIHDDGQTGVNCAVFRNEAPKGKYVASELILEAMGYAWQRWSGERLFTYIDPKAVQGNNPGYCFKRAGWRKCGITKVHELLIFECLPKG